MNNFWGSKLTLPKNFIFGYGSIINEESRNNCNNTQIFDVIPARLSSDLGYRRTWNYRCLTSKFTALGLEKVSKEISDKYFNSRHYLSRIGAWASNQSKILNSRSDLEDKIEFYKSKYPESNDFPRPDYWGGFIVKYSKIEFWEDMPHRIHKREVFELNNDDWVTYTLSP